MGQIPKRYSQFKEDYPEVMDSVEEMKQVAILTLPTIGFPSMMAAFSWIDDILQS